jgi:hypothetical protein
MRRVPSGWMKTGGVVALLAAASWSGPLTMQAQEADAEAEEAATPPTADPADVESIDAIIGAVYDVISGEAGEARDWDRFRSLFISEARLIPSGRRPDGIHGYIVWSYEDYVQRAGGQLEANGFFEDEAHRVTERWADIAHVFSTYNSYRTTADREAGEPFQRGINSFQLMFDGDRWWVVSIMWEGESPDRPISAEYLGSE